jgi:hypothetical protein
VINFIPSNFKPKPYWREIFRNGFSTDNIKKSIKKYQFASSQKYKFNSFRKEFLNLSDELKYDELSNLSTEYEAIIVGSDQVWGPSQHSIGSYFLSHLHNFQGKRISYAPCCAINHVVESNKHRLTKALKEFSAISVRNVETQNFVCELIGEHTQIVVDPTLLWNFDELIEEKPVIQGDYILTYILGSEIRGGHRDLIDEIKNHYPNSIVISIILTENKPQLFDWSDEVLWDATPLEWLNLFYHATFIYTDSFHGLLFAIKFKKEFIAYYSEKSRASRFIDFGERFGEVSNNIVNSVEEIINSRVLESKINYTLLDESLGSEIIKSKLFLDNSLRKTS